MYFKKLSSDEFHLHLSRHDLDVRGLTLQDILYNRSKSFSFSEEVSEMAFLDFGFNTNIAKLNLLPFSDFSEDFAVFSFKTINSIENK